MAKRFMARNKQLFYTLILSGFVLFNAACAQNPFTGKAYIDEEKLAEQSTVLLNNASFVIPLQNLDQLKIASVHFSYQYTTAFDSLLNKYSTVQPFNGNDYEGNTTGQAAAKTPDDLSFDLKLYNTVVVQLNEADLANPAIISFINDNKKIKNIIIALFGSGNALAKLNDITVPIIWCQRISPVSAFCTAQAIFGGIAITKKLDRNLSLAYRKDMGFTTHKIRLQYTVPEDAGVNASDLVGIDNIATEAILNQATPGCVVLVAKDGKVIFNKAYGYHTYDKLLPEKITDIFDLASDDKDFSNDDGIDAALRPGKAGPGFHPGRLYANYPQNK